MYKVFSKCDCHVTVMCDHFTTMYILHFYTTLLTVSEVSLPCLTASFAAVLSPVH